ncbi:MAG: U3 snoRNP protein [Caeruleum heppii]|nr:MAG: U3 snoRNP protein [Caeruleum heppii]
MAGASDKARFYLEQSVPELQELRRKKIFTEDEISSIAKKRSDFEHKINARGSHPADYARYAEFEMNLEALRRKRVRRLGIKSTNHSGQRRIFFVLDRATRKFHGDVRLWMQYVEYARKEKANKKVVQILTSVLRLHPTKPELWMYAARWALESEADMTGARSYMQRGLRFCKSSRDLWVEYAKLEMIHVAKIIARRRILGLEGDSVEIHPTQSAKRIEEDVIAVPDVDDGESDPDWPTQGPDAQMALQKLDSTPVLTGAIPLAIFDVAMKTFPNDAEFAERFFDMFAEFSEIPFQRSLLQHVLASMSVFAPSAPSTVLCHLRQPIVGLQTNSPTFPSALASSFERLSSSMDVILRQQGLAEKVTEWLLSLSRVPGYDPSVQKVIAMTLERLVQWLKAADQSPELAPRLDYSTSLRYLADAGFGVEEQEQLTFKKGLAAPAKGIVGLDKTIIVDR